MNPREGDVERVYATVPVVRVRERWAHLHGQWGYLDSQLPSMALFSRFLMERKSRVP